MSCCTFTLTGPNMVNQAIYVCETCQEQGLMPPNTCCCAGCADVCHPADQGHELSFLAFGRGYCDCGQMDGCQLRVSSKESTQHIISSCTNHGYISQDINGRIELTDATGLVITPFNSHHLVDIPTNYLDILKDASISLTRETKETYWISSHDVPGNIFEEYASSVFNYHVHTLSSASYDPSTSGAEWWIQVKYDHNIISALSTADHNQATSTGIDIHFDKDEEIGALFGVGVFPQISTVTYLSSRCPDIPTLIIQDTVADPIGSSLKQAYISAPVLGKHISFDGRLLHGAPIEIMPINTVKSSSPSCISEPRVTFLVNIWLNHKPANLTRLSTSLSSDMKDAKYVPYNRPIPFQPTPPSLVEKIIIPSSHVKDVDDSNNNSNQHGRWLRIPFVSDKSVWGKDENETGIYLKLWLPHRFHDARYQEELVTGSNDDVRGKVSSWMLMYNHSKCAASLEYETDDEFIDEMEVGLDLGANT